MLVSLWYFEDTMGRLGWNRLRKWKDQGNGNANDRLKEMMIMLNED